MGRVYHRDSLGRFASGGGSSSRPAARGGTLAARSSLTRSRQKLQQNASPAQRGAVTRAKNKAAAARQANTTRMSSGVRGVFRRGKVAPARNAGPRSAVVPFRRTPAGNSIRPAKLPGRGNRMIDRAADTLNQAGKSLGRARKIMDRLDRIGTRDALSGSAMNREIARQGGQFSTARKVTQRRQQRAFAVQNGRNPQIGSKALFIYQQQLRQLGAPANQRVAFRRKPMTEKQAARAKAAREKENNRRLDRAIGEDLKAMRRNTRSSTPKPKKPRRKKP